MKSATLQGRSHSHTVGTGYRTLVMSLVGASHPRQYAEQLRKLDALSALEDGPEIICDLSIVESSDGAPIWQRIFRETPFIAGCLPIYTVPPVKQRIDHVRLLEVAIEQMEGGVGLLTIHPTATYEISNLAKTRMVPCTSRGGGLVIGDLRARGWREPNAYQKILPELIVHARANKTVLSLGASYRSANIFDSCDAAQIAEIESQISIAKSISEAGVDVIIESPGHARPSDIIRVAQLLKSSGFPIMPLGPIPTDTAVDMDHVASAIGATLLGLEGCANILAAVTREEHTGGVPTTMSTVEAARTARVAAHVIDLELLGADAKDRKVARERASAHTCIAGNRGGGCDRCARACPLTNGDDGRTWKEAATPDWTV